MYSNVSSINFHSIQLGMQQTNPTTEQVAQKPFLLTHLILPPLFYVHDVCIVQSTDGRMVGYCKWVQDAYKIK